VAPVALRVTVISPPSNSARTTEMWPIRSGNTPSSMRASRARERTWPRPSSAVTPIARSSSAPACVHASSTPWMPTGRPPRARLRSV
jgi:hypothetical protein